MKHYISMSGLQGYMPDHCDVHATKEDAIETLVLIHKHQTDDIRYCPECLESWPTDDMPGEGYDYGLCPDHGQALELFSGIRVELMKDDLQQDGYFNEFPKGHGTEMAEVIECDCSQPWIHSESADPAFMQEVNLRQSLYDRGIVCQAAYLEMMAEMARRFFEEN